MMMHSISRPGRWMLGLAVLGLAATLCPAQSESGYALIVEQTPNDGGAVTPNSGVHKFGVNQMVTLMAEPRSGYRFLYWLGDVTDMTHNQTSVWLDSPKIVVAVFEKTQFELPEEIGFSSGGGGAGRDDAIGVGSGWRMGPGVSGGGGGSVVTYQLVAPPNVDPGNQSVPEPATLALLGLGSAWMLKTRRRS
jgi:hypothetical protein